MSTPKITVIIPTRERFDVLKKSLQTVTSQDYDNLEIIVSDNFSQDATEEIVRETKDSRVRYLNTGKRLSMTHNWEFALSHVTDGLVTIIGDDDGLLPGSLNKVANIIKSTGLRALRSSVCAYEWPSLTGEPFGYLRVPLLFGNEVRDSKLWLTKVLAGSTGYPDLPMLYNGGYLCANVIKEIKQKTGCFFCSCAPDVYSAVAIARRVGSYAYTHEPLAVNGASKHSTGTSTLSGGQSVSASPANKFLSESNIPPHKDFPLCADGSYPVSMQAMVYESYLQSDALGNTSSENTRSEQLKIILATSGQHAVPVREWGKIFASQHGLDFSKINCRANIKRPFHWISHTGRQVIEEINTCSIGSPSLPIRDVYDASQAAATIRRAKPNRLLNVPILVAKALARLRRS